MTMRISHSLDALNVIASNISEIKFSGSREFTNALLHSTEIVSLIRDTEPHERALFTAKPTHGAPNEPRTNTAVGAYLGDDMAEQLRNAAAGNSNGSRDVDVHLLLQGAERLLEAYPIPRGPERIELLRAQYEELSEAIGRLEADVARETRELEMLSGDGGLDDLEEKEDEITNEMLEQLLADIEDLDSRKLSLETDKMRMERQMGMFE